MLMFIVFTVTFSAGFVAGVYFEYWAKEVKQ